MKKTIKPPTQLVHEKRLHELLTLASEKRIGGNNKVESKLGGRKGQQGKEEKIERFSWRWGGQTGMVAGPNFDEEKEKGVGQRVAQRGGKRNSPRRWELNAGVTEEWSRTTNI